MRQAAALTSFRRRLAAATLLAAAALVTASCQAGPPTSTTATAPDPPGSGASTSPTTVPPAIPTEPTDQPTEPPAEVPVFEDAEFLATSRTACEATKPARVFSLEGPTEAPAKVAGYDWLHIVVLEMRGDDGVVGPPPPLPPGSAYYPDPGSLVTIPGGTSGIGIEAPISAWVDVLACVVLRSGDSRTYSGDRELQVTGLDGIVWLVDRQTGALIMEPWVVDAALPMFVNADLLIRVGALRLFPADVRPTIGFALGKAVPVDGLYQGGEDSSAVTEYDKPVELPEGTRLLPGHTFVLRLVVLPGSEGRLDYVEILCAPVGRVSGPPLRVGDGVVHDLGGFSVESGDVSIEGEFQTEFEASGRIRARSQAATSCGVPGTARWHVSLVAMVRATEGGYEVVVGG